jgi:hypothetical protein
MYEMIGSYSAKPMLMIGTLQQSLFSFPCLGLKAARVFSVRNHSCTGIAASEAPIRSWTRKERRAV